MRKSIILLLSVLCVALTACKDDNRESVQGYVVGKRFIKPHVTVIYNTALKMPMTVFHHEKWLVWVADSCGVHKVNVDSTTFHGLEKGEFVRLKID